MKAVIRKAIGGGTRIRREILGAYCEWRIFTRYSGS